jgi:subtilase family serine protease
MTRRRSRRIGPARNIVAGLAIPLALAGLVLAATSASAVPSRDTAAVANKAPVQHDSCSSPGRRAFHCLSVWHRSPAQHTITTRAAAARAVKPTAGYGPADIKSAYALPATGGSGQTVAIVDAYDNPKAESDLAYYRSAWGLSACTTANKCFKKVDQRGGKTYPAGDPGWGVEIALDVQAVSAACPACKILLVEADDASFESIGAAVLTAVRLGADVVSNSYGADEFNGIIAMGKKYYYHPHIAIVASSGDFGFTAASFPAVLGYTWAVGGTNLTKTSSGAWKEKAWDGAGSGCSAWITKPTYQKDPNCSMRTVADVSAVADPETGFAVYDTYGLGADNGWIVVGGTSVSAPLISGMIAKAGNADTAWKPSYAYAHRSGLKDVVGGSNGYCGGDYLCTGLKGYDGPTGLGSPRGLSAL